MKTLAALTNTGSFILDPIDLVIDYVYDTSDRVCEMLEGKLWTLLENLQKTYRFLKSKSVKGWKELLAATNRLSDFLHSDKFLDRSQRLKLLDILITLSRILNAGLLSETILAGSPPDIALAILNITLQTVIASLQKRLYQGSFSANATF